MTSLVDNQINITKILKRYIEYQHERISKAIKILEEFENLSNSISSSKKDNFLKNPINSFLLVKALTKDLNDFYNYINLTESIIELKNHINLNHLMPLEEDYDGVVTALNRLQDTYQLSLKDIINGNISQKYKSKNLNAYECFELGFVSFKKNDFYHATWWFIEAKDLLKHESSRDLDEKNIDDYISISTAYYYLSMDDVSVATEIANELLKINPNHNKAKILIQEIENRNNQTQLKEIEIEKINNEKQVFNELRDNYESLCRGEQKVSTKILSKLKCIYVNYHPSLLIAPIKAEELYDNPKVWFYHDVINDEKIETIKNKAASVLKRSLVKAPNQVAEYRISKNAWLNDSHTPILVQLSNLISAVTNLSMTTAEDWQVANYGIGGHYDSHYDFARENEEPFDNKIGNRIATWIFFLEAPDDFGYTVFPRINLVVKPVKGSAVFWHNLLPNGLGDYDTLHAACPVLFGSKWISNRWMHSIGQEFTRPCLPI